MSNSPVSGRRSPPSGRRSSVDMLASAVGSAVGSAASAVSGLFHPSRRGGVASSGSMRKNYLGDAVQVSSKPRGASPSGDVTHAFFESLGRGEAEIDVLLRDIELFNEGASSVSGHPHPSPDALLSPSSPPSALALASPPSDPASLEELRAAVLRAVPPSAHAAVVEAAAARAPLAIPTAPTPTAPTPTTPADADGESGRGVSPVSTVSTARTPGRAPLAPRSIPRPSRSPLSASSGGAHDIAALPPESVRVPKGATHLRRGSFGSGLLSTALGALERMSGGSGPRLPTPGTPTDVSPAVPSASPQRNAVAAAAAKDMEGSVLGPADETPAAAAAAEHLKMATPVRPRSLADCSEVELAEQAVQEYILMGCDKSSLTELSTLARARGCFIAVRPTAVAAHMATDVGHPTKPGEIKNKTSKEEDCFLHPGMDWGSVGAVLHYNPTAYVAGHAPITKMSADFDAQIEVLWSAKREQLRAAEAQDELAAARKTALRREAALAAAAERGWDALDVSGIVVVSTFKRTFPDGLTSAVEARLKTAFIERTREFLAEDPFYQEGGMFAHEVYIQGPFIYLRHAPGEKIYGDHDLFAYAHIDEMGRCVVDHDEKADLTEDLRKLSRFQAQHGPIYYWHPVKAFDRRIYDVIMGAHSAEGKKEPVLVACHTGQVRLCFFAKGHAGEPDSLVSVWERPLACREWLEKTSSGSVFLRRPGVARYFAALQQEAERVSAVAVASRRVQTASTVFAECSAALAALTTSAPSAPAFAGRLAAVGAASHELAEAARAYQSLSAVLQP